MRLKLTEIAKATGGTLYGGDITVTALATDSRAVDSGCIFAALKGERADGFDYIKGLDEKTGIAYLCDRVPENVKNPAVVVEDVLVAIGKIAKAHLDTLDVKKIAVTGSVGKTTTKECIRAALSKSICVHAASGNRNNELGLPLTALDTKECHDAVILEMGMRGLSQIDYLCSIARPDIAVITNIGISHIELLGSRENILKAKLEAVDNLSEKGVAILNGDDDMLSAVKTDKKTLFFGIDNEKCDLRAVDIVDNSYTLIYNKKRYPVKLSVLGRHNIYNSLAGIAVGISLGLDIPALIAGVEAFTGDGSRQNIYMHGDIRIFDDTYNASPDSMRASMSVLSSFAGRHILVLADMLELGDMTQASHAGLADAVYGCQAGAVICIGKHMKSLYNALEGVEKYSLDNNDDALEILRKTVKSGDTVLFKGSNSMGLSTLVKRFKGE